MGSGVLGPLLSSWVQATACLTLAPLKLPLSPWEMEHPCMATTSLSRFRTLGSTWGNLMGGAQDRGDCALMVTPRAWIWARPLPSGLALLLTLSELMGRLWPSPLPTLSAH